MPQSKSGQSGFRLKQVGEQLVLVPHVIDDRLPFGIGVQLSNGRVLAGGKLGHNTVHK